MRVSEAIEQADLMRPNVILNDRKKAWLKLFEGELAEMMGVELANWDESENPKLLLTSPYDQIYPSYLLPYIDQVQEEMDLYQIDKAQANQMVVNFKSYWRRNHQHISGTTIKGVWQ